MLRRTFIALLAIAFVPPVREAGAQGQPARVNVGILLEINPADANAAALDLASGWVSESLRDKPSIQIMRGAVEGDAVVVTLATAADASAALARLKSAQGGERYAASSRPDGVIDLRLSDAYAATQKRELLDAAFAVVSDRLAKGGVKAVAKKEGADRIRVDATDIASDKIESLIAVLTSGGRLSFNLVDADADPDAYTPGVPRNGRLALMNDGANRTDVIEVDPIITSADFTWAASGPNSYGGVGISFRLNPDGKAKFGAATTSNIGRAFAIVVDGRIISAPVINSPITTGSGEITGSFTAKEAEQIAALIRSNALPARLAIIERKVTPSR